MPYDERWPLEGLSQRLPPSNLQAEQALLGALLQNNKAIDRCGALRPDHFADPANARTFGEIKRRIDLGKLVDAVSLKDFAGTLDDGNAHLARLLASWVGIINVTEYAEVIRKDAMRRELIDLGERLVNGCFDASDPAQLWSELSAAGDQTTSNSAGQASLSTLDTAMDAALEAMERARSGATSGISTGFQQVDQRLGGLEPGLVYVIAGRPGMGKAQPLDAKVLLADGTWRAMGELRFGDALASVDGAPNRVSAVHERGERDVFRVTLSDGRSTECCGDHLWRVMYRDWDAPRVITASKLASMLACTRYRKRLSVEVVSGHFGSGSLPLDPYVLGVLLGDGSFRNTTARLTSADPEIVAAVQARLGEAVEVRRVVGSYAYSLTSRGIPGRLIEDGAPQFRRRPYVGLEHLGSRSTWPRTVYPVQRALVSLGLAGLGSEDKFIPECYLSASRDDRLDLLRGLMDTDGWAEKHAAVRFSSCSHRLADGVQTLVRSLGGLCSIVQKQPTCSVGDRSYTCLPAFVCRIRHPHAEDFFALDRKRRLAVRGHNATVSLNVASVDPMPRAETRCITVTHPSALYVTDDYIVTHNSAWGHQVAINVARSGVAVLELSLEMSAQQLGRRALATAARVPIMALKAGRLNTQDADRVVRARQELAGLPLMIDDAGGQSASQIATKARASRRKNGLGLIMVDHLNLMRTEEADARHGGTWAVERASAAMLQLAKDCACPVLLLAQLNRGVEGREDKRPALSDLRQAGAIEQDAYAVGFVYREEYYLEGEPARREGENQAKFTERAADWKDRKTQCAGKAEMIWRKVRDGEPGSDGMTFHGPTATFGEIDGPHT